MTATMTATATATTAPLPLAALDAPHPCVAPRLMRPPPTDPPYDQDTVGGQAEALPLVLNARGSEHSGAAVDLPDLAVYFDEEDPRDAPTLRTVEADLQRLFGRRRTPRAELPDPRPRAASAVRLLLEVLGGDRPTRQVAGWVSPRVLAGLENRSPRQFRALPRRPVLKSLRICEPADGVAEVSAVVQMDARCRAVALRLDGLDGRWVVTALHVG
jgi:hypothetical protein